VTNSFAARAHNCACDPRILNAKEIPVTTIVASYGMRSGSPPVRSHDSGDARSSHEQP
jgi:hypothetical protein